MPVGGGSQSLFSCLSVNSVIISRLRNESNIWQENTEEPSLLPSADHWLFLQTTVTVRCFTDYMTIWSSHTASMSSDVATLINQISTPFNVQIWGIMYTARYYREVSQYSSNYTSSWNSKVGLKWYPLSCVCPGSRHIHTSVPLSRQSLGALMLLCRVSHLKTVPSNDGDPCRRMRGSENMIWELT